MFRTKIIVTLALTAPIALSALSAAVDHGGTCAAATPLRPGVVATGYHDYAGDDDYFALDVPTPGLLRLRLTGGAATEPRMQLLDADCGVFTPGSTSLASSDAERVLWVSEPGRYHVRVRGHRAALGVPFTLRHEHVPAPPRPALLLETLRDAPGDCRAPASPFDRVEDEPPAEDEEIMVAKVDVGPPLPAAETTEDEPPAEDEEIMVAKVRTLPGTGDVLPGVPALASGAFYRLAGDLETAGDADVVTVRVASTGVLAVAAAGVELVGSLYRGSVCDSRSQLRADVPLRGAGLLARVEPGVYRLRLGPARETAGRYRVDLRLLSPGR